MQCVHLYHCFVCVYRYIRPLTSRVLKITEHDKFRVGSEEEVDALLREEKEDARDRIPYLFCASSKYPGLFVLSYLPSRTPRHESIRVLPEGYSFRKKVHKSVDKLIHWFKRHYKELEKQRARAAHQRGHRSHRQGRVSRFDQRDSFAPQRIRSRGHANDEMMAPRHSSSNSRYNNNDRDSYSRRRSPHPHPRGRGGDGDGGMAASAAPRRTVLYDHRGLPLPPQNVGVGSRR